MERLKKLAEIAILLPIAHLIACVTFLAGYIAMFGGNVSTLFAVSDSFTITLSNIFQIYAVTLILPLLSQWYAHSKSEAAAASMTAQQNASQNPAAPTDTKSSWWRKALERVRPWWGVIIFGGLAVWMLWSRFHSHKQSFFILILQMVQTPIVSRFHVRLHKIGIKPFNREIIWTVSTFIVTAFATGMDRGDSDRHESYNALYENHLRCNNYLVLRSASNRFIAVGKDQRRYVIDDKCSIIFTFPDEWLFPDLNAKNGAKVVARKALRPPSPQPSKKMVRPTPTPTRVPPLRAGPT